MKQKKESVLSRIGNKLPDVNIIFLMLTVLVIVASVPLSGTHTFTDLPEVTVHNMLSFDGIRWILANLTTNFINFPPLGIVLVIVIGTGVAEKSGLLGTLIKKAGLSIPDKILIPSIIFIGVLSSIASDAGYVVLIPLAAALFAGTGRNPLVGIAAAFAGVSAGFGANIFPTPGDGLLGRITEAAALANDIPLASNVMTMNYYFMIGSTFLLVFVGWFVTVKFIIPKVKDREFEVPEELKGSGTTEMSPEENKGLRNAGIALIVLIALIVVGYMSGLLAPYDEEVLRNGVETIVTRKPLLDNLIIFMILVFLVPGLAYGKAVGLINSSADYIKLTILGMKDNASIIVIAFFAGNFIAIFNYSGLGHYIATGGASALLSSGLNEQPVLLLLAFILVAAFINIFIGSASAKWALLAPVFIPMLYTANPDMTPELVQAAYRLADSSTNIISPLMSYMAIVVAFAQKYDSKFNVGTMMDLMYPYSFAFLISWSAFFIGWFLLGIPLGF